MLVNRDAIMCDFNVLHWEAVYTGCFVNYGALNSGRTLLILNEVTGTADGDGGTGAKNEWDKDERFHFGPSLGAATVSTEPWSSLGL